MRSEPCRNCEAEVHIDFIDEPDGRDWIWRHVPDATGACQKPEPRRRIGAVYWVGPGEL